MPAFDKRAFKEGIHREQYSVAGEFYGLTGRMDLTDFLDESVAFEILFEYSTDGGRTWRSAGGWSNAGGKRDEPVHPFRMRGERKTWGPRQADGHKYLLALAPKAVDPLVRITLTVKGGEAVIGLDFEADRAAPQFRAERQTIAVLQSDLVDTSGQTVTTPGIDTTTGSLIVLNARYTGTYSDVTDNNSQTYTDTSISERSTVKSREVYKQNVNGRTGHTFSLTNTGDFNRKVLQVYEIGDAATSSALDVTVTGNTAFSTSHATGSTATSADNVLALASVHIVFNGPITDPGGSWSSQRNGADYSTVSQVQATGQAFSATFTSAGGTGSDQWISVWKQAAASGTSYDGTIAETGSAADTVGGTLSLAGSAAESGAAADTPGGTLVLGGTLAETGSATDTAGGALVLMAAIAETGSAADTASGSPDLPGSVEETGSAADTVGGALVFTAGIAEIGAALDSAGALLVLTGAIAETGALSEIVGSGAESNPPAWIFIPGARVSFAPGERPSFIPPARVTFTPGNPGS